MSAFCKKCGSQLDPNSAFCDNCGAPVGTGLTPHLVDLELNTDVAKAPLGSTEAQRHPHVMSRKFLYIGGALLATVVVAVAASFFLFGPPPATSATLLPPFKANFEEKLQGDSKSQLCIDNLNYGLDKFNAGQNDSSTRKWMDALVLAGLYSAPVEVQSSGFSQQTLLQYVPTPELTKWREDNRLCVAKSVQVVDVIDITKPVEERISQDDSSKTLVAKGKVVAQATDTASWLEKPEVRATILAEVSGWEYKAGKLQKEIPAAFAIHDGKWVTLAEFKTIDDRQSKAGENAEGNVRRASENRGGGWFTDLREKIARTFNSDENPLRGVWGEGNLGSGSGKRFIMTITDDGVEFNGEKNLCTFLFNGKQVTATCEKGTLSFLIVNKDQIKVSEGGPQSTLTRIK